LGQEEKLLTSPEEILEVPACLVFWIFQVDWAAQWTGALEKIRRPLLP
jgi:hypothetical protein